MPPPATGPGEWKEPCAVQAERRGAVVGVAPSGPRRARAGAGRRRRGPTTLRWCSGVPPRSSRPVDRNAQLEQDLDGCGPALGRRLVQRLGELRPHPLGARGVGRREPLRALAVAGEAEPDQLVDRPDLAPRAELGEHLADVRPAHPPREPVRRALVLLVPGVRVRPGGDQHPQHLRRAAPVDRPQQRALDLAPGLVIEQEPQHRRPLGVEAVRDRVRALDARARVEQQAQAGVVGGLGRVVDGLVVVRVRARLEQQRGHPRLVRDARRAVERAERAELGVLPARVGSAPASSSARAQATSPPVRSRRGTRSGTGRAAAASRARRPAALAGRGRAPAPRAPARRRRGRAPRRGARRSGSSASSASAWSRRSFVASSTSCRARSSRATASASTRRTSRGQLASPSSRATASWAAESRSSSSPAARSRANAVASPARAACSSRLASRRARSRSIRPLHRRSPHVSPAVRAAGQRSIGT